MQNVITEERASESPFVEVIGRMQVQRANNFQCAADLSWNMLIVKFKGMTTLSIWGATTKSMPMTHPEGAEFLYIRFRLGTFIPFLPVDKLPDTCIILPLASSKSFWLNGSAWEFPDFENADTYVDRLVRGSMVMREPVVDAALQGHLKGISPRSVQRHFLRSTGITYKTVQQITRARQAAVLLEKGVSILDTVDQLGYSDQSHMTRSLKHYIGQTPAQIARHS